MWNLAKPLPVRRVVPPKFQKISNQASESSVVKKEEEEVSIWTVVASTVCMQLPKGPVMKGQVGLEYDSDIEGLLFGILSSQNLRTDNQYSIVVL